MQSVRLPAGRLLALYKRAMQLEVEFFSAQPQQPPSRECIDPRSLSHTPRCSQPAAQRATQHVLPAAGRIGLLVCDFDDTCTLKDSIGTLMGVAADAAARVGLHDVCR